MTPKCKRKETIEKRREQQKGHRARLCSRLIKGTNENFLDYEIVELMLFLVFKRKDTKPIAKTLINNFGSIDKIISASREKLLSIDGIGESAFKAMKIIDAVIKSVLKSKIGKRNIIDCFEDVINYCKCNMKHLIAEELRIIFLNTINEVIGDEIIQKGSVNEVEAHPREIVKKCIEKGASGFVLVHNHPSGDPTPSLNDVYITKRIKEAAELFNIRLHDHIIIGGDRFISFTNLLIL